MVEMTAQRLRQRRRRRRQPDADDRTTPAAAPPTRVSRVLLRLARPAGGHQGGRAGQRGHDARTGRSCTPRYDNLDEVTAVAAVRRRRRDDHHVSERRAAGAVGQPAARADDRDYDDQGRVYPDAGLRREPDHRRRLQHGLTTNYLYDHRGDLIETSAPGGLWYQDAVRRGRPADGRHTRPTAAAARPGPPPAASPATTCWSRRRRNTTPTATPS